MFWHRHFDITLLLAAIAMMSLQTPVRPPELYQTSERSLAAVVEPHTPSVDNRGAPDVRRAADAIN